MAKHSHDPQVGDALSPPSIENSNGFYQLDRFSSRDNMGYLLKRAWTVLATAVEQEVAHLDITYPQFVVMIKLHEGSCSTAAELAREVNTDTGAMTRLLGRMECKGLIRRLRSSEDRRVFKLAITESGQAIFDRAIVDGINVLNRYFKDFSTEEMTQLNHMLRRVIHRDA